MQFITICFSGQLGLVLAAIQDGGFVVSGLEMVRFDKASAAEFHEVYNGVLYEYMVS
jgi:nucleoside-diphosphate kinase